MKRGISTKGSEHISERVKRGGNWILRSGTSVPHTRHHIDGTDTMPARNPMQATDAQLVERTAAINKALQPHVLRVLRIMAAAGRAL